MFYPPKNSVFYDMNKDRDAIDSKVKYQINPKLTDEEMAAIYDSFIIENPDKIIMTVDLYDEEPYPIRFGDLIKSALNTANKLPTARLWLRQIPHNVHLGLLSEEPKFAAINGEVSRDGISLSPNLLKRPLFETVVTLMHELAHFIDFTEVGGLNCFPYEPVNDGKRLSGDPNVIWMSEAEYVQWFLIDEAEKNALSRQLYYEQNCQWDSSSYARKMNRAFNKYAKIFDTWTPPKESGEWTNSEIEREKMGRALFYAAQETMTGYMREFMKPYTHYFRLLPKPVYNISYMSECGPVIDFDQLRGLNLSMRDVLKTGEIVEKMRINLSYRLTSYSNLSYVLKLKWCKDNHIKFDDLTPELHTYLYEKVLTSVKQRRKLSSDKSSPDFADYMARIEGRYMGFITVKDMQPCMNPIAPRLYKDETDINKTLVNLDRTSGIAQTLREYFTEGLEDYINPLII